MHKKNHSLRSTCCQICWQWRLENGSPRWTAYVFNVFKEVWGAERNPWSPRQFFCFWRATFSRLGCGISEELAGFVPSRMEVWTEHDGDRCSWWINHSVISNRKNVYVSYKQETSRLLFFPYIVFFPLWTWHTQNRLSCSYVFQVSFPLTNCNRIGHHSFLPASQEKAYSGVCQRNQVSWRICVCTCIIQAGILHCTSGLQMKSL